MSSALEQQLDSILNTRAQRRRQREVEEAQSESVIRAARAEHERRQQRFCADVRSLLEQVVQQANRHLAVRPEKCQFCAVSGYFTGCLHVGGPVCNPIAYELRVDGQELGETLLIELTNEGMVEAYLGPFRPSVGEAHTTRLDVGWQPIPLYMFDARAASELLVRYFSAVTTRWPLAPQVHRSNP